MVFKRGGNTFAVFALSLHSLNFNGVVMQRVNSFIVDHTRLKPGIYESKVNGAYTYDIRFVAPQDAARRGLFMKPEVAHTLEHFLADFLRTKTDALLAEGGFSKGNKAESCQANVGMSGETGKEKPFSEKVLYVGPMGCLTGFYLLTTEPFAPEFLRDIILKGTEHILQAQEGEIPGASELTCGNWQYFDLEATKEFIRSVIIPNFTSKEFSTEYPYLISK